MRIFVLTSRIPYPLEKGDKLRVYHQIRTISKKHKVHLCCLSDEKPSQDSIDHLKTFCETVDVISLKRWIIPLRLLFALFSSRPFQVHYFLQNQAKRKVESLIKTYQPDHIFCQLIRCSEYVKNLHDFPKSLDYMDAFNMGMQRLAETSGWAKKQLWLMESRRLLKYEHLIFDYFDHHFIISDQDRRHIYHQDQQNIVTLPNGVDTVFFKRSTPSQENIICFTGNMSYPPNVDSAEFLANEILPLVREKSPETKLLLAGANPHARVKSLASEVVEVTGWMDDIRDAYNRAAVFVAPMRIGTGLQNKLLEAMSMETPCVTSTLANNALQAKPSSEVLIGATASEYADHILSILTDNMQASRLAENGRLFVEKNYSWEASGNKLIEVIEASRQKSGTEV